MERRPRAWGGTLMGAVALILVVIVFFAIGHYSNQHKVLVPAPIPTATPVTPSPTPGLAARSPHVLAVYEAGDPSLVGPCETCNSITFAANGPFYMITSCNPFNDFADAQPSYDLQLFNSGGHLIDTVQESCGDPNNNVAKTDVVPENQPAGQYKLTVDTSFPAPVSVVIVDASRS